MVPAECHGYVDMTAVGEISEDEVIGKFQDVVGVKKNVISVEETSNAKKGKLTACHVIYSMYTNKIV